MKDTSRQNGTRSAYSDFELKDLEENSLNLMQEHSKEKDEFEETCMTVEEQNSKKIKLTSKRGTWTQLSSKRLRTMKLERQEIK